jgi:hypothetical protein
MQVTVSENMDTIQSTILDDRRISTKIDSRDPDNIPRKSRLYYSWDFRHKEALSQMADQIPQCCQKRDQVPAS